MKILFVCLGNICRSPMAEVVFRNLLVKNQLDRKIMVSSAATSHYEVGRAPHYGTQRILKKHQMKTDGLVASQITKQDFEEYDWIIGMDKNNVNELKRMSPHACKKKIKLFLEEVETEYLEVPDPYYTGNFELTYELVNIGCQHWLEKIKKEECL